MIFEGEDGITRGDRRRGRQKEGDEELGRIFVFKEIRKDIRILGDIRREDGIKRGD